MEEVQAQQETSEAASQPQGQDSAAVQVDAPKKGKGTFLPALVAILAAIALCVGYFLPYTEMTEKGQALIASSSDAEIVSGAGVTWDDMSDASFVTWGRAYWAMYDYTSNLTKVSDAHNGYLWNFVTFAASGALAVLVLVFALARKATPVVLFSLINLGAVNLLSSYFEQYGPVAGGNSAWAFGHEYLSVVLVVLIVAGVWLFIAKKVAKRRSA